MTTLINSAYKNRGHAQMVGTNLKQRRMYNITMSCGRVLLDTLRHFLNYEKIITARMHARGNDDVDNKTSGEMNWKNGEHDKWSNHSYLSNTATPPKLKSLRGLRIRFEAMVTEDVDDAGLWVDEGMQYLLSTFLSLHHVLDLSDPLHQ
jgi:hypothetical protein